MAGKFVSLFSILLHVFAVVVVLQVNSESFFLFHRLVSHSVHFIRLHTELLGASFRLLSLQCVGVNYWPNVDAGDVAYYAVLEIKRTLKEIQLREKIPTHYH